MPYRVVEIIGNYHCLLPFNLLQLSPNFDRFFVFNCSLAQFIGRELPKSYILWDTKGFVVVCRLCERE